ncbi:stage II sporulation protein P [Natronincola peptidivorans]|uniref:Stage II sporulation protein P n=1 Tax=Natronincola peptidivorans TaxID=426128 RepID=A0A1I0E9K2_9FIRM|nr:stage II sporulation protein P [Natronincola peptidivorans]SET41877.1 stage II sporulation protein P [Natronincola peptidivorans]
MRKKFSLLKNYQNIIILVLILATLFFFGRMILNKSALSNSFAETENTAIEEIKIEEKKQISSQNIFLVQAIEQVFPSAKMKRSITLKEYMHNMYSSFIYSMFRVDFKNPVTFVQSQFPASLTQDMQMTYATEENPQESPQEISRDIFFVELDDAVATGTSPQEGKVDPEEIQNEDDLGELMQGIYLVGEDNIVDSLNSGSGLTLGNVQKPRTINFEEGKPHILIYHTHGTESYKPASEGNYHTLRKEYSVITIAEIMKAELEKRGYNVIHDTTYHDYPSYSGSYSRSLETAQKILKDNPSIKVVLDVHRDGYDHIETNPNRENIIANNRVTIHGETCTRFQFVIGPASPNRKQVETFASFVKAVSDSKYPGFSKHVLVKPYGSFNQFLADHYGLLEVGSNANTIQEARRTAVYLAEVLADSLDLIKK